jgi:cytochrome c
LFMRKHLLPVLLSLSLTTTTHAEGKAEAGKRAFAMCASCHDIGPLPRNIFGPYLTGVVGRKAGTAKGFRYSQAMKNADFVWTDDRLRAFLRSPSDVVPGTAMRFWGVSDTRQIDDIVAFLRVNP